MDLPHNRNNPAIWVPHPRGILASIWRPPPPLGQPDGVVFAPPYVVDCGYVESVVQPSRRLADRRVPGAMVDWYDLLPPLQIIALNEPRNALNPMGGFIFHPTPYRYDVAMAHIAGGHRLIFATMKCLYFYLLHIGPAARTYVSDVAVVHACDGPYVVQALQLLKQCISLHTLIVLMCYGCGDLTAPHKAWKAWKKMRMGGIVRNLNRIHVLRQHAGLRCSYCRETGYRAPRLEMKARRAILRKSLRRL